MFRDDFRGVGEALNETGQFGDGLIIRGSHHVLLTSVSEAATEHRTLAERIYMASTPIFSQNIVQNWAELFHVNVSSGCKYDVLHDYQSTWCPEKR